MDLFQLTAAFILGFIATFFFVATGGVGLITTPGLIFLGLNPQTAIATDLFAMLGGRLGGLVGFRKSGHLDLSLGIKLSLIAALGALIGAQLLLAIDEQIMRRILSLVMVALLIFLLLKPDVGVDDSPPNSSLLILGYSLFFLIGLWGTLFGAGALSFGTVILLFIFRKRFLEVAALLMPIGLSIGVAGLITFGYYNVIDWWVGVVVMAGKFLGGYLGSLMAIKAGDKLIRWIFIGVVLVSAIGLNL